MAERLETPRVTIPAGTAITAPVTIPLTFLEGVVTQVDVQVPTGWNGLVGFRIAHSLTQLIPYNPGDWVVVNGVFLQWPLRAFPTGQKWSVQAYNQGLFDHVLQLIFHLEETGTPEPLGPTVVMIG